MSEIVDEEKKEKVEHIPQPPHDADDCHINEEPYNSPEFDCGHYVDGPGPHTDEEAREAAGIGYKPGETIKLGPNGTRDIGVTQQDLDHEGPAFMGEGPGPGTTGK